MDRKRSIEDESVSSESSNKGTPEISSEEEGSVSTTTNFKPVNIDIRSESPLVLDQKSEGCCLPVAISDVTETILKRDGNAPLDLLLSPQSLVDSRLYMNWYDVDWFIGDSDLGLETIQTNPFIRMERPLEEWDLDRYRSRPFHKHCICGFEEFQREDLLDEHHNIKNFCEEGIIVEELKKNFREGGNNFPIVGTLKMGSFAKRSVSARIARDLEVMPYHHPPVPKKSGRKKAKAVNTDEPYYHSVVIMGLNTMSKDSRFHYCWVKNSHSRKWGINGFSRVGLDVFVSIGVPSYDPKAWAELRAKESENAGVAVHDGPETQTENEATSSSTGMREVINNVSHERIT